MAYKVLTGLTYPPDRRAEIGDIVDDLPAKSVKWLLAQGLIEELSGTSEKKSKSAPVPEPTPEPDPDASTEDGE